ncbi:MAG: pseudouridine synthase [Clostridia bacterium]|nr:pseudouridine synthase [Clostridia bacterium]
MRLDRWLVTLGIGSRKDVQRLVRSGAVAVNGQMEKDPGKLTDEKTARLNVSGSEVDGRLMRHVMLHKPAGLLTAARDKKQPTIMDLLPEVYQSIGCMPVGRLDKDTTGLLLLTCDGELNHRLLSPQRHVDKVYIARVDGPLDASHVDAFARGLDLGDFTADGALLEILTSSPGEATAKVTVHEGKFHQIKRMFEAVGRTVTQLHRERFGPLVLDEALPVGQWRELTEDEIAALYRDACMEEAK